MQKSWLHKLGLSHLLITPTYHTYCNYHTCSAVGVISYRPTSYWRFDLYFSVIVTWPCQRTVCLYLFWALIWSSVSVQLCPWYAYISGRTTQDRAGKRAAMFLLNLNKINIGPCDLTAGRAPGSHGLVCQPAYPDSPPLAYRQRHLMSFVYCHWQAHTGQNQLDRKIWKMGL